ncbi:PD-(D/E)XK nuclease family protein [Nonomuraea polychroma]|uniref:PD-(D/E)XK nuclease family protein n=1 Tax=Nonomuraea polychroma TaxID=46176 RepID=UPI003D8C5668
MTAEPSSGRPAIEETADSVRGRYTLAVADAFRLATREGQAERKDPHALSISMIGGCRRHAAYRWAGTPPSDPDLQVEGESRAANLGAWEHAGLLPHLAAVLGSGALIEVAVELLVGQWTVNGTLDLWVDGDAVVDLKTVREWGLGSIALAGKPRPRHRYQVLAYALALLQKGHRVRWLVWIYLDRASGDEHVVVEEFTEEAAMELLERVWELRRWARYPREAPRDEYGPGLSWECDGCAWLRDCWGPTAVPGRPGAQRILTGDAGGDVDAALMADMLALYDEGRRQESTGAKKKRFAAAAIDGRPVGVYGDWYYGLSRASDMFDEKAAKQLLEKAGIPEPRLTTKRSKIVRRNVPGRIRTRRRHR